MKRKEKQFIDNFIDFIKNKLNRFFIKLFHENFS